MNRLLSIVIVLSVLFLLFSFSTEYVSQDRDYYYRQMRANEIQKVTGQTYDTLDDISDALIQYLRYGDGGALTPYFSEDEVDHMVDVYALFHLMRRLSLVVIGVLSFSIYGLIRRVGAKRGLGYISQTARYFTAALLALCAVIAVDFHRAWFVFHEIFFANDLWLMDPTKDLMIQMLPEPFFLGMATRIGGVVLVGLIALCMLSLWTKGEKHEVK